MLVISKHDMSCKHSGNQETLEAELMTTTETWLAVCLLGVARRYYAFLSALEAALPVGKDRGGVQVAFGWGDAFQPRDRPAVDPRRLRKGACLHAASRLPSTVCVTARGS